MFGLLLITGNHTHQENYARALAADPRCRLVGLTDEANLPPRRQELNRALAAELGIPYLDDLDAALAREDVHIVCICAEPERRRDLTIRCARAGKHLYLDKEIATTVEGCREVVEAIRDNNVISQTFSLVRSPIGQRARQALDAGRVGELTAVHGELFFAKGIGGTADLSLPRQEKPVAERFTFIDSKRELLCVGWYPLALFHWLTGLRVKQLLATTANYFFAEHQRNGVEDFASVMLEYENGLQGTITVGRSGWSSHPSHGVHQVQLIGTAGTATLDAYRPRFEIYADAPAWKQPATPHPEDPMGFWTSTQEAGGVKPKIGWWPVHPAVQSDASYFLDCVEAGRDSDLNAAAGAHLAEVILAAYRSAATGDWVRL